LEFETTLFPLDDNTTNVLGDIRRTPELHVRRDEVLLMSGERVKQILIHAIRSTLNIPKSVDILEHLNSLPSPEHDDAQEKIREIERKAMRVQKPQLGLAELMQYLDRRGVRKAICARNFE